VEESSENKLRDKIFNIFLNYQNEKASDRRQVYIGRFNDSLKEWCKYKLRYKNAEDMRSEIFGVAWRVITKNYLINNRDGFFRYLSKSLKNAKNEYYRKLAKIRIPRELHKLKTLEEVMIMKEKQKGRPLNINERNKCILIWKSIENIRNVKSLSYDISDEKQSDEPLENNLIDDKTEKIIEAINYYFEKRKRKTELVKCYKALFTVSCIKKGNYFNALYSVLDQEIINEWQRNNEIPELYVIYQKYHQVPINSASSRSSNILDDINKELINYLIKKYPKLFS